MSNTTRGVYGNIDEKLLNEKISKTFLFMGTLDDLGNSPEVVYEHIYEAFTKDEMAHITATFIALRMKEMLEKNPTTGKLLQVLKMIKDQENNLNNEQS